ncbi:PadR family transcriptional regulator [Bacillus massiliigorillae]|uniref:PadR family transcriptional regulator n=1 Tax=Bacillus massiliigorillae TaxID=1243664 RepID=UPI0003A7B03B|nr:PadR family transcriptional regulator [Bacillus massiliigorillae]
MDHRSLVLLGLLMAQSQHGYQINEFIENNLGMITDMKKPTAYATLDKLSKKGYIEVHMEQEGNRPPRKVYTINENGKKYFYELLYDNLSSAETVHYQGDLGLMFMDHLPLDKALDALHKRLERNHNLLVALKQTPSHGKATAVDLAVKHKIKMAEAEIAFLESTIEDFSINHS